MIVELHELEADSFALVRRFKIGNVEITVEVVSGVSALTNDDVKNFRRAVSAMEHWDGEP